MPSGLFCLKPGFYFFLNNYNSRNIFCPYFYSPWSFIVLSLWVIRGLQAVSYDMYISMKCNTK